MTKSIEIYFRDLNKEAQEYTLEAFKTTERDENWDVFPIAIMERETE